MTANEAVDMMKAMVLAGWRTTDVPANILFDDVPGSKPPANGKEVYARVTVRHALANQTTFTPTPAKRYTSTGTLFVQVFAPVGSGMVKPYAYAQTVQSTIRAARGAVWYRNTRLQEVGSNGGFEQINVLSTFSYDHVE